MKKNKKWIRFRHRVVRHLAWLVIYPFSKIKYGLTVGRIPHSRGKQFLLLYNHQTPMDQFFVGMTVHDPVYYLASEDIFSNGFLSALLRHLVAPIPIKKQSADVKAVINCLKVAREGGSIAIAPEGNRTYSGKTEYIAPSIAPLARKMQIPIAFVRIEGGYGVQPRWSDCVRRGKTHVYVSRVMEPDEFSGMTDAELHETICRELYVNEANPERSYKSRKSAEYLERAIYVCPDCGLSTFESHGDRIRCLKCGKEVRYLPDTSLEGVGFSFPFGFVNDWYEYQKSFVNSLDTAAYAAVPLFRDTADVYRVIVYQKKERLHKDACLSLYGDRVEMTPADGETAVWHFADLRGAVVLGRNKLNLYVGDQIFQIKGNKRFNALKYVNLYYRHKNQLKESENEQFLFLGL